MPRPRLVLIALGVAAVAGFALMQVPRESSPPLRPPSPDKAVGAVCRARSGEERRTCYIRVLVGYLDRYGVARAVATLDSLAAADSDVAKHAHEYAHGLGMLAYERAPDISRTFVECGEGAASGCRHGFLQAYFKRRERVAAADVRDACRPFETDTVGRALLFQCLHGMGHGLTMFHGHDAPRALADCDRLTTGWSRTSCHGGVFMEAFLNAAVPHHSATMSGHQHSSAYKAIDPADPLYPCSIMARQYLMACYEFQPQLILHLKNGDVGATARECDRAPPDMRVRCYIGLGRDVTTYAARDPRKTAELCALGTEQYRPACYSGALSALVNWTGRTDAAFELCRIVAEAGQGGSTDAPLCYAEVGRIIATRFVTPREREQECLRAPDAAAAVACRRGVQRA